MSALLDQLLNEPMRTRQPLLPPAEAESLLSKVAGSAMGGLRMVGNILDTPGSVVRGLVAGDPSRALAGVLDPAQRVSGRDILETYGLAAPNQPGLFNSVGDFAGDVAGFGAEILTDPLTWVGGKALTTAGQAAEKSGALADLARQAGLEGTRWSAPIKAGYAGLLKVPGGVLGTGPTAAAFAEKVLDPLSEAIRYGKYSPVRVVRGLADHRAGDTADPFLQKLHEFSYLPTREANEAAARMNIVEDTLKARELGIKPLSSLERTLADAAEGLPTQAPNPQAIGVANFGSDLAKRHADLLDWEQSLGMGTKETEGYFPRYVDPSLGKKGSGTGKGRIFGASHASQRAREEILQDLSRNTVDDMVRDVNLQQIVDPAQRSAYIQQNYAGRSGGIAPGTADRLQDWVRQNQGERFYGDLLRDSHARELMSARARAGAETVHEGLARTAFAIPPGAAPPPDAVRVANVLQEAGLGYQAKNAQGMPLLHAGGGLTELAKRLGIDPAEIGNYYVKADDAKRLTKYAQAFTTPESVEPFLKVVDGMANVLRSNLTSPFPSFHFRNLVTGAFINWTDDAGYPALGGSGVLDYISPFRDADTIAKGGVIAGANARFFGGQLADDAAATSQLAKELFAHRAAGPSTLDQVTGSMVGQAGNLPASPGIGMGVVPGEAGFVPSPKVGQSMWDAVPKNLAEANPLNVRGRTSDLTQPTTFAPAREGEKWTSKVEFVNRASHYLAKRAQGYAPEIAATQTRRAHFDYAALSKTEKKIGKRAALFYTFPRKNLPFQVEQMLQSPGKMAGATRAINAGQQDQGFTPGWIGENTSIPLGPEQGGTRRWITGIGLPLEEAFGRFKFGPGGGERTAQSFAAMLRPELRMPLEWFTGKQMFSGRPIDTLDPPIGRTISNLSETLGFGPQDPRFTDVPVARDWMPLVEHLAANSPAARFLSTARTALDPRKHGSAENVAAMLANLLTGVRISDVDTAKAKREALDILDRALLEDPMMRTYQSVFLPKEFTGMLDPRTQQLLDVKRSLKR